MASITLALLLTGLAVLAVIFGGNIYSFAVMEPFSAKVRGFSLTYYRAPRHIYPPYNLLDPYDSFQKNAHGELIIKPTGTNRFSHSEESVYRGYFLRTRKGNPVTVYQQTPGRQLRLRSNCHGLTFLDGDFWMLGSQVDRILDDNNWVVVSETQVQSGDVVVYREPNGRITHTARVIAHDADGQILVASKDGFQEEIKSIRATDVVPY
jgi:hypothetical protein